MLKLAGAAAVGAVAATASGVGLAAADNGLTINPGSNTTSADPTKVLYTGTSSTDTSFVFDAGGYSGNSSFYPAALAGWTTNATTRPASGVYGYTTNPAASGSSASTTPQALPCLESAAPESRGKDRRLRTSGDTVGRCQFVLEDGQ